jgi:hypothetical protein
MAESSEKVGRSWLEARVSLGTLYQRETERDKGKATAPADDPIGEGYYILRADLASERKMSKK